MLQQNDWMIFSIHVLQISFVAIFENIKYKANVGMYNTVAIMMSAQYVAKEVSINHVMNFYFFMSKRQTDSKYQSSMSKYQIFSPAANDHKFVWYIKQLFLTKTFNKESFRRMVWMDYGFERNEEFYL